MNYETKLAELLGKTPASAAREEDPTVEYETGTAVESSHEHVKPAARTSVTVVNLFRHPDAHPIALDLCLLRKYGPEWYGWEPETLDIRIPQDFKVTEVSALTMAKVQACKAMHLVDTFWKQWEVFLWCTMALNGMFPDFEVMQVPTVSQCAISVDIANQLRADVSWSSEVSTYIGAVHQHDGIFVPQPPLSFVHVDSEDTAVDVEEVKKLWPAVLATDKMPSAETVTAEQLRRMLVVNKALRASREALRLQLPLVQHV